jgi:hypothetical protein
MSQEKRLPEMACSFCRSEGSNRPQAALGVMLHG